MPGKIFQFVAVCCSRLAFHEAVVFPWFERTCTSQITNEVSVWFLTEPVKLHKLCSTQCFISSDYIFFCFVSLLLPIALVFTCTVRVQWEVSVLSERWTSACTGGFLLSHFNIAGWTVMKLKKKKNRKLVKLTYMWSMKNGKNICAALHNILIFPEPGWRIVHPFGEGRWNLEVEWEGIVLNIKLYLNLSINCVIMH